MKKLKIFGDMIRLKNEYNPDIINGWIIKFIPNYGENKPSLYDELKEDNISINYLPFEFSCFEFGRNKNRI